MNTIISRGIFGIPPTAIVKAELVETGTVSWCSRLLKGACLPVGPIGDCIHGGSIASRLYLLTKGGETLEEFLLQPSRRPFPSPWLTCSSHGNAHERAHKAINELQAGEKCIECEFYKTEGSEKMTKRLNYSSWRRRLVDPERPWRCHELRHHHRHLKEQKTIPGLPGIRDLTASRL